MDRLWMDDLVWCGADREGKGMTGRAGRCSMAWAGDKTACCRTLAAMVVPMRLTGAAVSRRVPSLYRCLPLCWHYPSSLPRHVLYHHAVYVAMWRDGLKNVQPPPRAAAPRAVG